MTAVAEITLPPAAFRVLFSDGDREVDAGEVVIHPGFTFQRLQSLIGDMVGVASHRIKLYLLRQRRARSGRPPPEIRRKTPIGEGTDFAAVAHERGCAILAQVKRTRKDRRGKGHRDRVGSSAGDGGVGSVAPDTAILRRPVGFHGVVQAAEKNGAGLLGLFHQENLMELQRRRERHLLATAAAAYYRYAGAPHGYGAAGYGGGCALVDGAAAVCGVCAAAAGERTAPFHWCVRDRVVTEGFRSSAGPIQRPPKSIVHAFA